VQNILLFISIYMNIQNILATTHTLLKRTHICMLKVLCQNLHVHIQSILLPKITYAHLKYFISIQNFLLFHSLYLYIYAHWWANVMSYTHLHLFEKEFSCHLSTLERQFPIIYINFGKHSRATFNMCTFFWKAPYATYSQIYIFWKAFLRYQSNIYRFLKGIICYIFTHFARHFHAIHIHIYTYHWKVFSMLPRSKVFLIRQPTQILVKNLSNMS